MKRSFWKAFKTLWKMFDKKMKFEFVGVLLLCATRSLAILALPQIIACLTAKFLGEPTLFFGILLPASWSIEAVIAFNFAALFFLWTFSTVARAAQNNFNAAACLTYKERAMRELLTPRKNIDLKKSVGEIIFIIESSTEAVGDLLAIVLIEVFPFFVSAAIALVYLATINVWVSLGGLILACGVLFISKFRSKIDKKLFIRSDEINSKISNNINNCVNNLSFIVFTNSSYHELNLLKGENKKDYKLTKKSSRILVGYWGLLYLFEYAYIALSLVLMIKAFGVAAIGVNTQILVVSYLDKVFSPVNDMGHFINILAQMAFRVCRINEFIPAESDHFSALAKQENKLLKNKKIEKIEVRDLEIEIGDFHRQNIKVTFEANKLTCIVGLSGCGKTTLIGCILGLKEYKSGEIIVNDKYQVRSLFYNASKIAVTLQNGTIFDRSIMDNICYPQHQPNSRAKKNIQRFKLDALIHSTQTPGESKSIQNTLSGGEKKRISFVRAISRPAEIYIFDEPTNDLDADNVQRVLEAILRLKKNNIVIVISHDDRLISLADEVYRM